MTSARLRDAIDDAARRRRLLSSGRRVTGTVRTVRPTRASSDRTPAVEIDVEVPPTDDATGGIVTVVERIPFTRRQSVEPGAAVSVVLGRHAADGAMIDWSAP